MRAGARQSKLFVTMSPPMALGWEFQAGGVHVSVGCTARWMPSSRYSAPPRGQLSCVSCEGLLVPTRLMWTTKESLMGFGEEK